VTIRLQFFVKEGDAEVLAKAKAEQEKVKKLQNLFGGLKFFLNREVPRETLTFLIR
jgi:pescadillo protein